MRRAVSGVADISLVRSKDWETVQIRNVYQTNVLTVGEQRKTRNVYRTNVPAVGGQRKNQLSEERMHLRCGVSVLFSFFCLKNS